MFQRTPSVRWRDKGGRIWDIHVADDYFGMTWRAWSASTRGKNVANVITRDHDMKLLPFALLADIHVDRRMENRGLGSMLLTAVIEGCRARGHEGIEGRLSQTDSGHFDKLKHFYEKFGFIVTLYPPEDPRNNLQWPGEIRLVF